MPEDPVASVGTGDGSRPVVNVIGDRVALGPLSGQLLTSYQAWMNDFATQGWAGYPSLPEPLSDERMAEWYQRAATDRERMFFTIYETESWRAIGFCVPGRHRPSPRDRRIRDDHR